MTFLSKSKKYQFMESHIPLEYILRNSCLVKLLGEQNIYFRSFVLTLRATPEVIKKK